MKGEYKIYTKVVPFVKDSLDISTNKDSIIIDFFGESGTSEQAVLELNKQYSGNRKFILIEQMDYVKTVTV